MTDNAKQLMKQSSLFTLPKQEKAKKFSCEAALFLQFNKRCSMMGSYCLIFKHFKTFLTFLKGNYLIIFKQQKLINFIVSKKRKKN